MRTDQLDYDLPDALIARRPAAARDDARLLVVLSDGVKHHSIQQWPDLLAPGSLVVLNDTRVLPARLVGNRAKTGGRAELLLLRPVSGRATPSDQQVQTWTALGRANRGLRPGNVIEIGSVTVQVRSRTEDGLLTVTVHAEQGVRAALETHGGMPIPPYLRREDDELDRQRYQTVYAARDGSVAAPTAGLHLTPELLEGLEGRGVRISRLTLHVGLGTFQPVTVADLDEHPMHSEQYRIGSQLASAIEATRASGGRVIAVGTTVVRALESAASAQQPGLVVPGAGETRLLIQPGYQFRVVDGLLTNFHQPRSTLLALVAAFVGRRRLRAAYRTAVARGYRFLSYGDAMWIPRRLA